MTQLDGFDRTLIDWLDEQAGHGMPGYLDETLARTIRTRQRAWWSSPERWLPVQTTLRLAPAPKFAWLLVALALALALAATVLIVGSRQRVPEPFGLAANGMVVYGTTDGDIHAYDPATGVSKALITGPTQDETPDFAPDGSKFVFARETEVTGTWRLMLADADGTDVRPLTGPIYPKFNDWSKDSTRVAVVDTSRRGGDVLSIYGVDGSAAIDLPVGMEVDRVQWRSSSELVFLGHREGTYGLYAIATDGTAPRALLPATTVDRDWMTPVVSPDGDRIAYTKWVDGQTIRVLDLDSGKDVAPVFDGTNDGDGWPTWSPDSTRLVFSRWNGTENHLAVGSATGGSVVEMGPGFPDFSDGAIGAFSPDGSRVIAHYGFDPAATWLLDPAGGSGERVLTGVSESVTWQRLAP